MCSSNNSIFEHLTACISCHKKHTHTNTWRNYHFPNQTFKSPIFLVYSEHQDATVQPCHGALYTWCMRVLFDLLFSNVFEIQLFPIVFGKINSWTLFFSLSLSNKSIMIMYILNYDISIVASSKGKYMQIEKKEHTMLTLNGNKRVSTTIFHL